MMRRALLFAAGLAVMTAMTSGGSLPLQKASQRPAPAPTFKYRVVRSYPHDREAFTQGLRLPSTACSTKAPGTTGSRASAK